MSGAPLLLHAAPPQLPGCLTTEGLTSVIYHAKLIIIQVQLRPCKSECNCSTGMLTAHQDVASGPAICAARALRSLLCMQCPAACAPCGWSQYALTIAVYLCLKGHGWLPRKLVATFLAFCHACQPCGHWLATGTVHAGTATGLYRCAWALTPAYLAFRLQIQHTGGMTS